MIAEKHKKAHLKLLWINTSFPNKDTLSQHQSLSMNLYEYQGNVESSSSNSRCQAQAQLEQTLHVVATDSRRDEIFLKYHTHDNGHLDTANRYKQVNGTVCCHSFKRETWRLTTFVQK